MRFLTHRLLTRLGCPNPRQTVSASILVSPPRCAPPQTLNKYKTKSVCSTCYAQSFTQDTIQSWNPILGFQGSKGAPLPYHSRFCSRIKTLQGSSACAFLSLSNCSREVALRYACGRLRLHHQPSLSAIVGALCVGLR